MEATELIEHHAKGTRGFRGAELAGAELFRAQLWGANLSGADLIGARLAGADLAGTSLEGANLEGAGLESANLTRANLTGANLTGANLTGANLTGADLTGASLGGVQLGGTLLVSVDLTPLCSTSTEHVTPSTVDYLSIVRSIYCPTLKRFLRDIGMPQIFVDYMVDCARSLSPTERFTLMLSTFISYGGPDEPFARKLNDALKANGVNTFFYPLDAKLGEWNADIMHRGIREHDRVVFVCSESALSRPGVRTELNEARRKEAANGGESCLIPITIDGYAFSDEFRRTDPDLAEFLLERAVGDFRGADKDEGLFHAMLPRLADALRRQLEAAAKADAKRHE